MSEKIKELIDDFNDNHQNMENENIDFDELDNQIDNIKNVINEKTKELYEQSQPIEEEKEQKEKKEEETKEDETPKNTTIKNNVKPQLKNGHLILIFFAIFMIIIITFLSLVKNKLFSSKPKQTEQEITSVYVNDHNFRLGEYSSNNTTLENSNSSIRPNKSSSIKYDIPITSTQNNDDDNIFSEIKDISSNKLTDNIINGNDSVLASTLSPIISKDDDIDKSIKEIDAKILELENSKTDIDKENIDRTKQISFYKASDTEKSNIKLTSNQKANAIISNLNKLKEKYFNKKEENNLNTTSIADVNKILNINSKFLLAQGSFIPSILLTEINTDLAGNILAQVRENVYDSKSGKYLLIPKGARLFGTYNNEINASQKRVFISFSKIFLPNGKIVNLTNMRGVDNLGNAGIRDKVNNHVFEFLGNAVLGTLVDLGQGYANSFITSATNSKEKQENNISSKLVNRAVRQPTLTIARGFKFNILLNDDIYLEKYLGGTNE